MARTDNDSWEITESVGATALGVASARAAETESDNPLIEDPFARVFLDAAGDGVWNWHANGDLPAEVVEAEPDLPLQRQGMVSYMASRTKFFDSFFLTAANDGIKQAVILAAGLDSRFVACTPEQVPGDQVFDEIWSNPPIRIGKDALHDLLLTWLPRLAPDGVARMVVGKNLGADSLASWLTDQGFPTVKVGSAKGFRVLETRRG